MRKTGVLAALLVLASLTGCGSGGTLLNTAALTPDKADVGAGSSAYSADDAAKSEPDRINPLADPNERPTGGREVIENPSLADVMLTGTLPEMSFGRPDAPVTVIEYA